MGKFEIGKNNFITNTFKTSKAQKSVKNMECIRYYYIILIIDIWFIALEDLITKMQIYKYTDQ